MSNKRDGFQNIDRSGNAASRLFISLICPALTFFGMTMLQAQESQPLGTQNFVPPNINMPIAGDQDVQDNGATNPIQLASGTTTNPPRRRQNHSVSAENAPISETQGMGQASATIGTRDPVLGERIARISNARAKLPQDAGQFWREYDITPYTQGRTFPSGTNPEQTIVDWVLRQTGLKVWHSKPFGFMTADAEKLYVYHTEEIQREVADIVDRFVAPQFANDSCKIRAVAVSRPDWITRGHRYLRPIPILTPGVQGWIVDKDGTQLLLQELGRRNDFKEIAPPQFLIPNGIAHHVASKRQRSYLRDVQSNATALNGYAEDRVTMDEGFSVSFTPLSVLDGLKIDATIKLDIVQVEKMIPLMIDVPTATNPRQRVQVESPQVSHFSLDEQIRWPKDKILLLDLGTIPNPNREQSSESSNNIFSGLTKNLSGGGGVSNRSNILLFIEHVSGLGTQASPIVPSQTTVSPNQGNGQALPSGEAVLPGHPVIGTNSSYWQSVR